MYGFTLLLSVGTSKAFWLTTNSELYGLLFMAVLFVICTMNLSCIDGIYIPLAYVGIYVATLFAVELAIIDITILLHIFNTEES